MNAIELPELTWHGDHALKSKRMAQSRRHRDADQLRQGNWATGVDEIGFDLAWKFDSEFRGCSYGCTLAENGLANRGQEIGEVDAGCESDGWPLWLGNVRERMFEALPAKDAPQWHVDIMAAVPVGLPINLDPVRRAFMVDVLTDPEFGCLQYAAGCEEVVRRVADLISSGAGWESDEMESARSASASASSASYAADASSAGDAAYAAYAAASAYAAYAASAAADAYGATAYAAAYGYARKAQCARLIEHLRAAGEAHLDMEAQG